MSGVKCVDCEHIRARDGDWHPVCRHPGAEADTEWQWDLCFPDRKGLCTLGVAREDEKQTIRIDTEGLEPSLEEICYEVARQAGYRKPETEAKPKDTDRIKTVFDQALARMEAGREKYGSFDPSSDRRDMLQESLEELMDSIVYIAMRVEQLRCKDD